MAVQSYWAHVTHPLFVAFFELSVAARHDEDLADILLPIQAAFDEEWYKTAQELYPEWRNKREGFDLALNLSQKLMEGMAVGQLVNRREERIRVLLDYLADRLGEIYNEGDSTAAGRHAART